MNPLNNKVSQALIVAIYSLAAFLLVGVLLGAKTISILGEGITPANTISVTGTGDAYAIPDIATVDFDVTAEAADVATAQTQVTTQSNAVITYLEGQGIASADVKTTDYTIEPHYVYTSAGSDAANSPAIICNEYGNCPPYENQTISGYDVTDSIEVTIRDTSKAGTILAGLGSQKVTNLSGLNFSVDNPDSVEAQARQAAITDAKSNAKTLASQLGIHLGSIVNFSENNGGVYEPMVLSASATAANGSSVPTPVVPAGQNKVTSNVTITYQIN